VPSWKDATDIAEWCGLDAVETSAWSKLGCRGCIMRDGHGKEADDTMGPLRAHCRASSSLQA
jgi:hypothetical protein